MIIRRELNKYVPAFGGCILFSNLRGCFFGPVNQYIAADCGEDEELQTRLYSPFSFSAAQIIQSTEFKLPPKLLLPQRYIWIAHSLAFFKFHFCATNAVEKTSKYSSYVS